jgi:hypothetical protein
MVNGPDHAAAVFTDRARDPAITDRGSSSPKAKLRGAKAPRY